MRHKSNSDFKPVIEVFVRWLFKSICSSTYSYIMRRVGARCGIEYSNSDLSSAYFFINTGPFSTCIGLDL